MHTIQSDSKYKLCFISSGVASPINDEIMAARLNGSLQINNALMDREVEHGTAEDVDVTMKNGGDEAISKEENSSGSK